MLRRHGDELAELPETFEQTRGADPPGLSALGRSLQGAGAVYVGSGGALATATLGAALHCWATGRLAVATTPLQTVSGLLGDPVPMVLVSARAKHPDVLVAARAAREQGRPVVALLTQRPVTQLSEGLKRYLTDVVSVPSVHPDGFLATNSVLAMGAALVALHGAVLPDALPSLAGPAPEPPQAARWVVVYGRGCRAVAEDLEARASETGLLDVVLTDLRNLGHGRHVGLARRADSSLVVLVTGPDDVDLGERTVARLPAAVPVVRLQTALALPAGALDLLAAGIRLFGAAAADGGEDPGAPLVPGWGRSLYHLGWQSSVTGPDGGARATAVRAKSVAAGLPPTDGRALEAFGSALDRWLATHADDRVTAVVLDYDGTCCTTAGRLLPPTEPLQEAVLRVLDAGLSLGFASGRGRSLVHGNEGLRGWVPECFWPEVTVGLYNGGLVLTLDDDVPDQSGCGPDLTTAAAVLLDSAALMGWSVEVRLGQVTVEAGERGPAGRGLADAVNALLGRRAANRARALSSGHSVDVVPWSTSKRAVVEAVSSRARKGSVLAVGDSGQMGGNDAELLAAVPLSLTVARCSPDPDRCWYLSTPGVAGPDVLTGYLTALEPLGDGSMRLDLPGLLRGPRH